MKKNNIKNMKTYNPTTPTLRHTVLVSKDGVRKNNPEKSLLLKLKSHSGRNSRGVITVRHQGGGVKKNVSQN